MKVGDLVTFVDKGTYARWFFGKMGICEISSPGKESCRVRWLEPVEYHGRYTSMSDFGWDKFEVHNEMGSS